MDRQEDPQACLWHTPACLNYTILLPASQLNGQNDQGRAWNGSCLSHFAHSRAVFLCQICQMTLGHGWVDYIDRGSNRIFLPLLFYLGQLTMPKQLIKQVLTEALDAGWEKHLFALCQCQLKWIFHIHLVALFSKHTVMDDIHTASQTSYEAVLYRVSSLIHLD